jgi:hypothetical protein
MMKNILLYALGGAALLKLTRNNSQIGKIVDGPPEGVTPCLDGKFSTHIPRSGVCSHHLGWKGVKPKTKSEIISEPAKKVEQSIAPAIKKEAAPPTKGPEVAYAATQSFFGPRNKEIVLPAIPEGVYIKDVDYETARRAYNGTSMSPDRRGAREVRDHRYELVELWKTLSKGRNPEQLAILRNYWVPFVDRYTSMKMEYFYSHSNVMSTMVTGPANFPTRSNRKKSDAADNKMRKFIEYWDKFIKRTKRNREIYPELGPGPIESGTNDALKDLQAKLAKEVKQHELNKKLNKIIRSKKNVVEKLRAEGMRDETIQNLLTPDYAGRVGIPQFDLANRNGRMRNLRERIAQEEKVIETRSQGEKELKFLGGYLEEAHEENRLRIFFDDIPSPEMRNALKKSGWKWSPKNKAWQRQLTENAWRSAEQILSVKKT